MPDAEGHRDTLRFLRILSALVFVAATAFCAFASKAERIGDVVSIQEVRANQLDAGRVRAGAHVERSEATSIGRKTFATIGDETLFDRL